MVENFKTWSIYPEGNYNRYLSIKTKKVRQSCACLKTYLILNWYMSFGFKKLIFRNLYVRLRILMCTFHKEKDEKKG